MNTYSNAMIQAFKQYREDVAKAVKFTHPDYSHSGIVRERVRRLTDARKTLIAKIPAKPAETVVVDKRPEVLASLGPKTADQVAVQGREWAKVEAILKSGRPLEEVVLNTTSVERLAAIADNAEIWAHSQGSGQPDKIAGKINGMIFDRLVEVGHEGAVNALAVENLWATNAAWNAVLNEALTGEHSVEALGALQSADPEGFDAYVRTAQSADPTGEVGRNVRALDNVVVSGNLPKEG